MKTSFLIVLGIALGFGIIGYFVFKETEKISQSSQHKNEAVLLHRLELLPDVPDALKTTDVAQDGRLLYLTSCERCHGTQAQGGGKGHEKGPNLTDNYWLHGNGDFNSIKLIIMDGLEGTAMPGWKNRLQDDDIAKIAVYIRLLQGTTPPNAALPQGRKID